MDEYRALAIVSALADGANPVTGEIFAADSPYQSPEVIRALFVAVRALESRLDARGESNAGNGVRVARADLSSKAVSGSSSSSSAFDSRERNASRSNAGVPHSAKPNSGKPWSADEDRQLLTAFDNNVPLADIATAHGRTTGGVRARLEKHGRLEPSPATRWPERRVRAEASQASTQASTQVSTGRGQSN